MIAMDTLEGDGDPAAVEGRLDADGGARWAAHGQQLPVTGQLRVVPLPASQVAS